MIIAIDGPAGSGKSTTARAVARRLGFFYLDTGAMYRAAALQFIRQGLPAADEAAGEALARMDLLIRPGPQGVQVFLSGEDVSARIREADVTSMSSKVSRLASVRERMVEEQRKLAAVQSEEGRGVVLEGRDIGTVVFPQAELKVFLTADLEVRARRRTEQLGVEPGSSEEAAVRRDMAVRDERDSSRETSPLKRAVDAVEIDTTELGFHEQVARIVALAGERKRSGGVRS